MHEPDPLILGAPSVRAERAMDDRERPSPPSSESRWSPWWLFAGAMVVLLPLAGFLVGESRGETGLLAFGLGLALSLVCIGLGKLAVRRQVRASQVQVMREMMLGSFIGVFFFLIATVVIARLWKPGLNIAVLTALTVYLSYKFFEVWIQVSTRRPESAGDPGDRDREPR